MLPQPIGILLVKKQIEELLERGPLGLPLYCRELQYFLQKKPIGSLRFCVDYHALNKLTIKDLYQLACHQDFLGQIGSSKYFTSINLRSGYWQCCISYEDNLKTAFFMNCDLYKWVLIPMGLTNAPATFMLTMNYLFSDMLDSCVAVFLDNILVYLHTV